MTSKNNLSTKIIILVECILLISSILFCTVSVYRAKMGIRRAINQRMLDIANCASGSINGDILKAIDSDDIGSPEYNEIYNTLTIFRDNVGELEYVYSIKEDGKGGYMFVMDTDPNDPGAYGDSVTYTEALDKAGHGTAAVDTVPYSDAWGEFYSAYSPVFDSSGKVAGIITVDFSEDWYEDQLSSQTRSTISGHFVILLFTLMVAAFLSFTTVRPFVRMQGRLLEGKMRAESANNAKSDFLANMSHEIRTPINAVLGMNEMILREYSQTEENDSLDVPTARKALDNIGTYSEDVRKAGHNLLAIVNDILDFSKIEAGRLDIADAPFSLSSLIVDLNNMTLFKAQDKDLEFSIEADSSLPDALSGDEVRIRQILTNLLNNAVKYTDRGSVRFMISGEKTSDDTLLLKAVVRDTGIGIRPEDIDKLFTKFERLEMQHNSTVEGTGLGLAITKRLLDMMGGNINVDSTYGKGSVFSVRIPVKIISSDKTIGNIQAHLGMDTPKVGAYHESFRAPNAHILVVDDTKINLTVVVNLLKSTQIKIDTATSGAEAIRKAAANLYDLILMDQRMPEMDGTEALHRIRDDAYSASNRVPVICLTADAVMGAKDRYIAEGFSDYITKPIDSTSLEKMLIRHLPEDKVIKTVAEVTDTVSVDIPVSDDWGTLRLAGIDPQTGLHYCKDNEELYRGLLKEYATIKAEKTEDLNRCLAEENWQDYGVYVHSLKSTSKMIGAADLSAQALKLETAANNEDIDTIRAEHDDMMTKYEVVTRAIISVIPEAAGPGDDRDVIEFSPASDK